MESHIETILWNQNQIASRVTELAAQISADLLDSPPAAFVGVATGAFLFLADLVRQINLPITVDFIRVESYGCGTESSGKPRISSDLKLDVCGKHVILVEDIVDSGRTLECVIEHMKLKGASCVSVCTFLDKPSRRKIHLQLVGQAKFYSGFQNLRRDAKRSTEKPKGPRAIVLCITQEHAEECFQAAKFILEHLKSKNAMENDSIGLFVTTPDEVLQFIEEGNVALDEIKYLVFDEVDDMFDNGLGPDIRKILSPLKELVSNSVHLGLQTILTTSMMMKVLHKDLSSLVENLEKSHAGQVAAVLLEIDQTEAFCLLESPEALKKKVG